MNAEKVEKIANLWEIVGSSTGLSVLFDGLRAKTGNIFVKGQNKANFSS